MMDLRRVSEVMNLNSAPRG